MKHKVRIHKWLNGMLQTAEHEFESFASALKYVEDVSMPGVTTKVYDQDGDLVHSSNGPQDSYA